MHEGGGVIITDSCTTVYGLSSSLRYSLTVSRERPLSSYSREKLPYRYVLSLGACKISKISYTALMTEDDISKLWNMGENFHSSIYV